MNCPQNSEELKILLRHITKDKHQSLKLTYIDNMGQDSTDMDALVGNMGKFAEEVELNNLILSGEDFGKLIADLSETKKWSLELRFNEEEVKIEIDEERKYKLERIEIKVTKLIEGTQVDVNGNPVKEIWKNNKIESRLKKYGSK